MSGCWVTTIPFWVRKAAGTWSCAETEGSCLQASLRGRSRGRGLCAGTEWALGRVLEAEAQASVSSPPQAGLPACSQTEDMFSSVVFWPLVFFCSRCTFYSQLGNRTPVLRLVVIPFITVPRYWHNASRSFSFFIFKMLLFCMMCMQVSRNFS